jgi:hypothetical protein
MPLFTTQTALMSAWDIYPANYREREIKILLSYVKAGECGALIGLSGSGKSNLLGFIANRMAPLEKSLKFHLMDCNLLVDASRDAFFLRLVQTLDPASGQLTPSNRDGLELLEATLEKQISNNAGMCLLLDRFDYLYESPTFLTLAGNLRALRDRFKYQLTYLIGVRRPIADHTELAELFFGHTLWLGPMSKDDAMWSASRDAKRFAALSQANWDETILEKLVAISWGYPSLLRSVCEAYAEGAQPKLDELQKHPAVIRRVAEFWADKPSAEMIRLEGLEGQPLLQTENQIAEDVELNSSDLTAKEHLLLEYFQSHSEVVCTKDELIHAVWPEDVIFEQGIRDESLAQLVRRLRVKIEPNPTEPRYIHTIPGRGYLFRS